MEPRILLSGVREAIARATPVRLHPPPETAGRASVALVLAGREDDLRLCFIRRAEREGDHWSGQMAFPGGRAEEEDTNPKATAERETREEIGLPLDGVEYLGPLSEVWIRHSGLVTRDVLSPFVYYAGVEPPPPRTSAEVAEVYWIPLAGIWDARNATTFLHRRGESEVRYHGICWEGRIIWGLTYMILDSLGELLGPRLPR